MAEPASGSLSAAIEQAAQRLAQEPARAEQMARAILSRVANDPRAILILASARRRQGDAKAAHDLLAPLARAFPKAANTHYELGASLAALGQPAAASAALRRAVTLKPELAEAWKALGDVLFRVGDTEGAEAAYAGHLSASIRDPSLRAAAQALQEGRLAEAQHSLRQRLMDRPDDPEALRLMAEALIRSDQFADAEVLLARCLELDPNYDGARFTYAEALFRQQKAAEALPHVEQLVAHQPDEPAYLNLLAACLGLLGEDARVAEIYQALLADYPQQPKIWLNYGHALRAVGRRDEAVAAYRRAIALAPGFGDAYWSLANMKVASFGAEDEAAMRAQAARPDLSDDDRLHLNYALGKALEDSGDDQGAFEHYAMGAAIRHGQVRYSADETTNLSRRSQAFFTPGFFAARAGFGATSSAPIFIVGLPRSGSTLIEQILASHSTVEGTMELPYIDLTARNLSPYPVGLQTLAPDRFAALGEAYLEATLAHRKLGRPSFIDKLPNNFQHIGLIQLILPNSKIIDARRHPLGACFSAFKQHFAQGQTFSYDLQDLGAYYRDYVELMNHFNRVLPGRVHRVIYEDLVEDTEAEVRRLLDYCGLPFEEACLRFYENDRSVRTVSSEQVRQPIYREGLDQWRRYEPWLDPLKRSLGPALDGWRGQ
jgi:tetratricopeptide (TPR) repeat protein